jgi:hypothetical protein
MPAICVGDADAGELTSGIRKKIHSVIQRAMGSGPYYRTASRFNYLVPSQAITSYGRDPFRLWGRILPRRFAMMHLQSNGF